jgi:hypothetical protein
VPVLEALRLRLGAELRLKEGRDMSGWLLYEENLGAWSGPDKESRGDGNSVMGGNTGIMAAFKYSFPNGFSRVRI